MRMQFEYINKNAGGKFPISSTQARAKEDGPDRSLVQTTQKALRGWVSDDTDTIETMLGNDMIHFQNAFYIPSFNGTHLKYAMLNVNRIMLWWFSKA